MGISHGAAVEIEKQWRKDIRVADANAVVDLAKVMKKLGRGPADCAEGFEIGAILKELGAKRDATMNFLSELSEQIRTRGIPAKGAAGSMVQIIQLAQRFCVRPEKVPDLLEDALKNLGETEEKLSAISNQYEEVQKKGPVSLSSDANLSQYRIIRRE